jgi:hypothetical protein
MQFNQGLESDSRCLVVDDKWEKRRFRHAQEPTKSEESTEILDCRDEKCEATEAEHHAWQDLEAVSGCTAVEMFGMPNI